MNEIISAAKDKYVIQMCEKLNDLITAPKTSWEIANRFLNTKKIPAIPPLFVNRELISYFSQKASIFNKFLRLNVLHYKIQAVYLPFI